MPLVLLVGVNQHWHTIIFGCALIAREAKEEYTWLLEKFVQCMGGVKPTAILIDQCSSIEKGIEKVLSPHTVHRFYS
jgi:MULE transposase domain